MYECDPVETTDGKTFSKVIIVGSKIPNQPCECQHNKPSVSTDNKKNEPGDLFVFA